MNNKQKGFAVAIALLIVALVAGLAFYKYHRNHQSAVTNGNASHLQTPTEQSSSAVEPVAPTPAPQIASNDDGTKTYINSQYGFQVSYPANVSTPKDLEAGADTAGKLWLIMSDNKPPYGDLQISVITPVHSYGGSEPCDKGYDNNNYTHVTINGLDFTRGDVSSDYEGMNSKNNVAFDYCLTALNSNQYDLIIDTATPTASILRVINSFTLTK